VQIEERMSALVAIACSIALLLPRVGFGEGPDDRALSQAIRSADFTRYFEDLTAWLGRRVPTDPADITEPALNALLADPTFKKALVQRHFMAKVWGSLPGVQNLGAFAKAAPANKEFLAWLLRNEYAMDTALLTRTPSAGFARADDSWSLNAGDLTRWRQVWEADPQSRSGLYLRLAIAVAIRPPGTGNRGVGMQPKPCSALERYMHYKKAHRNGELFPSFDHLTAWELTHVVSSGASNKDLAWGREMLNTFRPDLRTDERVVQMTSQMRYQTSQIPYKDFSCVLAGGGKCGPRSSFGVFINQAFGIPAVGVGQPGHAAVAYKHFRDGWQVCYGRGWNVSKVVDRYKMSGAEFLKVAAMRSIGTFAKVEHLRWITHLVAKKQAAAIMKIAREIEQTPPTIHSYLLDSKPDEAGNLPAFEAPSNVGDHYLARLRGFLYPPATGEYVFAIASDDDSDLLLSTDANPQNRKLIAYVRGWTDPRKFDAFPTQKSKPIRLQAGKRYYIEALHKEGEGNDHLAVAWHGPGVDGVIPGRCLSPYPSGPRGAIGREVWRERGPATRLTPRPEPPIEVEPGVIHLEAEDFFTRGGVPCFGGQHPSVPVLDCYTGGKQLHFQALMAEAHVGYKIQVPETGIYQLTANVATINWGQSLYVRSFGATYPVKSAKASAVYHGMVKELGPQMAVDNNMGTRWAVDEGVDKAQLEIDLGEPRRVSKVMIDERTWNRVSKFRVEYKSGNDWKALFEGTNIGIDFHKSFPTVIARYFRLSTLDCRGVGGPTIWEFNVGDAFDGRAWLALPWTRGLWQTTKPVDIYLVKGPQTLWVCAGYQRGVSLRWIELKRKRAK